MPGRRPGKLDINDANQQEMEGAGLTSQMAELIIQHRDRHGRFDSLDQIGDVAPLDPSDLDAVKEVFTVKPDRPFTQFGDRHGNAPGERRGD